MRKLVVSFIVVLFLIASCESEKDKESIVGRYEMRYYTDLSLYDSGLYSFPCDEITFIMNRSFEKTTYYFDRDAAFLVFEEDGTWYNEGAMINNYWGKWERTGDGKFDYDIEVLGRVPRDFRGICTMSESSISIYFGEYGYNPDFGQGEGWATMLNAYNKE